MQTPILALPDFTQPFAVHTDVSGTGIGAILIQHDHLFAYFSKQLSTRMQHSYAYA